MPKLVPVGTARHQPVKPTTLFCPTCKRQQPVRHTWYGLVDPWRRGECFCRRCQVCETIIDSDPIVWRSTADE